MNLRKITITVIIALLCIQLSGCSKVENEPNLTSEQSSSENIPKFQLHNINGGELNEEDKTMPNQGVLYLSSEDAYKKPFKIKDTDEKNNIVLNLSIVRGDLSKSGDRCWPKLGDTIVVERNYIYSQKEKENTLDKIDTFTIVLENNKLKVESHILQITYTIRPFDSITYYICVQIEKAV